ncbi:MAG: hypothetical protein V4692_01690 [Bdellovibrionota bacterium]
MKALSTLVLLVCFSSAANASFYQIDCSNAAGTIQSKSGHLGNYVSIKATKYDEKGPRSRTTKYDYRKAAVEQVSLAKVLDETESSCRDGIGGGGYVSWRSIEAVSATIKRVDGKAFPEGTPDLQEDGSVKTVLMCETNGNSMVMCPGGKQ